MPRWEVDGIADSALENRERVIQLMQREKVIFEAEADVECDSFCFWWGKFHSASLLYFFLQMWKQKEVAIEKAWKYVSETLSAGSIYLGDAPNAFDQLFNASMPYIEGDERSWLAKSPCRRRKWILAWVNSLTEEWERVPGLQKKKPLSRMYSSSRSLRYLQIPVNAIQEQLSKLYGNLYDHGYSKIWRGDGDQTGKSPMIALRIARTTRVMLRIRLSYILGWNL